MKNGSRNILFFGAMILVMVGLTLYQTRKVSRYTRQLTTPVSIGHGMPMVLVFGSSSCSPCKAMLPDLVEMKSLYAGKVAIQYIDVFRDPEMSQLHQIEATPTLLFFDGVGIERFRQQGYVDRDMLTRLFDDMLRIQEEQSNIDLKKVLQ